MAETRKKQIIHLACMEQKKATSCSSGDMEARRVGGVKRRRGEPLWDGGEGRGDQGEGRGEGSGDPREGSDGAGAAVARRSGQMGIAKEMRASTLEIPQGGPIHRRSLMVIIISDVPANFMARLPRPRNHSRLAGVCRKQRLHHLHRISFLRAPNLTSFAIGSDPAGPYPKSISRAHLPEICHAISQS
ncbi:hypothetical protein E2562_032985 [Oryza meyeriana var. granulata]|uniref:Uncharacterized protein n=1 Tax=Oryza meyeriana var. granulata TaxID=110450 RepID=A0A6G1CVP3_9ORYZ|nr:hypothetical protein E2562_032985 [Oryza meyeriana var. granulata]